MIIQSSQKILCYIKQLEKELVLPLAFPCVLQFPCFPPSSILHIYYSNLLRGHNLALVISSTCLSFFFSHVLKVHQSSTYLIIYIYAQNLHFYIHEVQDLNHMEKSMSLFILLKGSFQ